MSSGDSDISVKPTTPSHKKRWTFWRVLGWIFASLLLIILIAAAYVWQNRYAYLEDAVQRVLAEQGLDAQLSIKSVKKKSAALTNIVIDADGERVFSAKTLSVDYNWRDALKGHVNRIELSDAALSITVDEKGKVIDGWMPESNSDSELVLPPQGLHLNNSRVKILSPYGEVSALGDVTFNTFEDFTANFVVTPAQFSYGSLEVKGGGKVSARIKPGDNVINAALDFTDMVHPLGNLSNATVKADVTFDLVDELSLVTGPLSLDFTELSSETVSAENGRLEWDGSFAVRPNSAAIRQADGQWSGILKRMTYSNADGRSALAKALTLNGALSAAPVTTHFADGVTRTAQNLLKDADVSAAGQFLRVDDKVEVKLDGPLTLKGSSAKVSLSSVGDINFYDYNRETEDLLIAANVKLIGDRSVALEKMILNVRSPNGVSITDVSQFSTDVVLADEWRVSAPEGDVRMAPLRVETLYVNNKNKRELQALLNHVDYDGPLPGGYVRGLKTAGLLSIDLNGGGLKTSFAPQGDGAMTLDSFETSAGWTAENVDFALQSGKPFYIRGTETDKAGLTARLENVSAGLVESATGRRLDVTLSAVDVATDIIGTRQDWTLGLFEAEVTTDDFGGVGTVVGAKEASLRATLSPNTDTQIELTSDAARVKTDQISTQNMKIGLKGTPRVFHLGFGDSNQAHIGIVEFSDQSLPQLPLRGHLDYTDGLIVGEAITVLPKAEDADINITFRLKEGEGTAKIDIERLSFAEKGFQPQNLIPALQGKIANVAGSVSATIDIAFVPGKPLQSSGRARLDDVDFGTLPGPFSGVNTEIEFTSVFPLVSSGVQRMTMDSFNPGVDLLDGVIEYELIDGGVNFISAKWPLANGFISLDPTVWKYNAPENRVVLRIEEVSVGAFLGEAGSGGLTVTGDVVGEIPVVIASVDVRIDNGRLGVENGGVIQYRTQELTSVVDLIPDKYITLQDYQQFQEFRNNEDAGENVGKDLAFTALRNFEYKSLTVRLDGPLDGEIEVDASFLGRNPKILAGTEFEFNVNIVGELVNLVRSLKPDGSFERIKGYQLLQGVPNDAAETP